MDLELADKVAVVTGASKGIGIAVTRALADERAPVDADAARTAVIGGIGGFATGRFTTPEEVATLVVLLASERTANVTGANYVIDGGLIKTT